MKVMISLASTSAKDRAEEALKKQQHKVEDLTDKLSEAKAENKELKLAYFKCRGAKSSSKAKVDKAEEAHKKQQHKVADLTDKLSEAKAKHKELRLKYLKLG